MPPVFRRRSGSFFAQHATSVSALARSFDALVQTMDRGLSQSDSPRASWIVLFRRRCHFVPPTESRQNRANRPAAYRPPVQPAAVPASNQTIRQTGPGICCTWDGVWAAFVDAASERHAGCLLGCGHHPPGCLGWGRSSVAIVSRPVARGGCSHPTGQPSRTGQCFGRQARTATDASAAGPAPWLTLAEWPGARGAVCRWRRSFVWWRTAPG